jgi:hypothetical protein
VANEIDIGRMFCSVAAAVTSRLMTKNIDMQLPRLFHRQKIFPSGRNGSVRVDALRQSRQRHPGGGVLPARRQFNASRSISPSDRCFTVSSRSVGLLF